MLCCWPDEESLGYGGWKALGILIPSRLWWKSQAHQCNWWNGLGHLIKERVGGKKYIKLRTVRALQVVHTRWELIKSITVQQHCFNAKEWVGNKADDSFNVVRV